MAKQHTDMKTLEQHIVEREVIIKCVCVCVCVRFDLVLLFYEFTFKRTLLVLVCVNVMWYLNVIQKSPRKRIPIARRDQGTEEERYEI